MLEIEGPPFESGRFRKRFYSTDGKLDSRCDSLYDCSSCQVMNVDAGDQPTPAAAGRSGTLERKAERQAEQIVEIECRCDAR